MLLVGIPLVFIDLGVGNFNICIFIFFKFYKSQKFLSKTKGQFRSTGPLTCWTMVPIFRGIGLSMNIVNAYTNIYYNMILAYSLYYLVLSLTSQLPWEKCNPSWSSPSQLKYNFKM